MTLEKGLPAVPRGLSREMTAYLQSLHTVIASISGFGRNSSQSRAARIGEVRDIIRSASGLGSGEAYELAAGSVTESRLANNAVTASKIAESAIETRHIAEAAIISDKLADGCISTAKLAEASVTREKLDAGLLPVFMTGKAKHRETVSPGKFLEKPLVWIAGQRIPVGMCGEIVCEITNLHDENGSWFFDVTAAFEMACEDGEAVYPGQITWAAIGFGAGQ